MHTQDPQFLMAIATAAAAWMAEHESDGAMPPKEWTDEAWRAQYGERELEVFHRCVRYIIERRRRAEAAKEKR
jgi:hypothetical protein